MRTRGYAISSFAMVLGLLCGTATAENAKIENELLVVELQDQVLALQSRQGGACFVPEATFVHEIESATVSSVSDSVWGRGREMELVQNGGWRTRVRLYRGHPFAHLQIIAGNDTGKPLRVRKTPLLVYKVDLGLPLEKLRTLGTGGLGGVKAPGSYTYSAVVDPETRRGVVSGWLTHERGVGVFLPKQLEESAAVETWIEFGQLRMLPGRSRPIDTLVVGCFDDARLGLEAYADAVARQYAIELPPQPSVYCTWYHAGASTEDRIAANTDFAAEHLKPFGLDVMQIDDRWQALLPEGFQHEGRIQTTGPVKVFRDSNDNYPNGMAHTAERITSRGMIPGIWFMPFAGNYRHPWFDPEIFATNPDGTPFHDARWSGTCLDLSDPEARAFVARRVRRIHGWGYRYFKLDGMHTGAPSHNIYVNTGYREDTFPDSRLDDPDWTHIEAYRRGLQIVRENAPDTLILGCNVSQNMVSMGPAFGLIDAMRIGPDNGGAGSGRWGAVKVGAWHGTNLYFLNGRVWHNDPDPVYVRESNPLHKARLMCSWVAVSGSMLTVSYQFEELPEERLDLLKRTMPGPGIPGRPVDLFEADQARIWLLTDTRRNVRRDVIGLFNWNEKEPVEIVYDMGRLGLDPKATYIAFDYWAEEFIEPIQGTLRLTVPAGSCRVLAVRPEASHPQLVSTSRHIAQCMVDVLEESWDPATLTLSGKSRVVADDTYELRIALPKPKIWTVRKAVAGKEELIPSRDGDWKLRLAFTPDETGEVDWSVGF